MAVLIWLAIYPMITLLLAVLGPALAGLPLPLRSLVLSLILVPYMVFVGIPTVTRVFRKWLWRQG
jgi:antibiotic biosynthesis monooxygenase (ABM) superfamily enzyme